ncbi:MAG: NAD(P)/FAD-dependent oxidoreductase [Parvibaculum sp.]|uniref:phytoene desaturase family protein n=1 Tax=Parvibaculum sp. TaxID=2024848 RepID=UPI002ABA01CB|nr:NAD(P)/FAD-dependent oxidoreductase [Parvibaculum sp.]MDZ4380505.1 NAD(P)/FAD-dependent oxidoreductase [Parvibaculum sp.]
MKWGGAQYDAIVIGGGHNGLVAAARLASSGARVLLAEAGPRVGGAATTSEITPGYSVSSVAHLLEGFPRRIERKLKLHKHGLRYAARDVATVALDRDGHHILLPRTRKEFAAFRDRLPKDADSYREYVARRRALAEFVAPLLGERPPALNDPEALKRFLRRSVWRAALKGGRTMQSLLHMLPEAIGDRLDAEFEAPLLKAALAFDATLGGSEGPYAPGTSFRAVLREAMRMQGQGASLPVGGLGAVSDALAASVAAAGGDVRVDTRVVRILVEEGRAAGVELAGGVEVRAALVLSALAPRATMLELVGTRHLETGDIHELRHLVPRGAAAKVNLALDRLPQFTGLAPELHGSRLLIAPSLTGLDEAANAARGGELPFEPVMEILLPSVTDPLLAPEGQHVMSIIVHHVPNTMPGGWEPHREALVQRVVRMLGNYAPGIEDAMFAGEILTPPDIEEKYGLAGGDWHQGDLRLDRLFAFRPAPAYGRYETPLPGLWLCGAGSHPGGGVTGLPGWLAAGAVLAEGGDA